MSYCILKMHKRTLLQKDFDMDKINEFLNHKLPENFLHDDDKVIEKLEKCIERLLRFKLDSGALIEPIPAIEQPRIPFGDLKDNQELINQIESIKRANNKNINEVVELVGRALQQRVDHCGHPSQTGFDVVFGDDPVP